MLGVKGGGYLVQASGRTLGALPQPPAAARLLIETVVREDAIRLCRFTDPVERGRLRYARHGAGGGGEGRIAGAVRAVAARPGGGHRRR